MPRESNKTSFFSESSEGDLTFAQEEQAPDRKLGPRNQPSWAMQEIPGIELIAEHWQGQSWCFGELLTQLRWKLNGSYLWGRKRWTNFFIVGKEKKREGKKRIVEISQCNVLGFLWVFSHFKHNFGLVSWSLGAQAEDTGGQCAKWGGQGLSLDSSKILAGE